MVKRNRTNNAREVEKPLNDNASTRNSSRTHIHPADDVIVTLANAHENKRARQVTEWERAQPLYLRQSA
ncbi:MAG: hypothetical protein AB7F88_19180 [Pyrinomonadaceae bacterium]